MTAQQFSGDLAGARFADGDLTGSLFREVDLSRSRFQGVMLHDVEVDGDIDGLVINGVRIDELLRAELERREPDRMLLRGRTVHELARGWEACRERWVATEQLLDALPPEACVTRVGGEWSAVETMRHLVFVTDAWFRRSVLGLPQPFSPWGLAPDWMEQTDVMGLSPAASPTLAELCAVRAERSDELVEWFEQAGDDDLELPGAWADEPGFPADPSATTVGDALRLLLSEEFEHHRFCRRDLERGGWLRSDQGATR